MPDRNINCGSCGINMGTIRDAKLRKDVGFTCSKCRSEAKHLTTAMLFKIKHLEKDTSVGDLFDGAFTDIFRKGR